MLYDYLKDFYQNKKIFLTGHTGFKGSWMCMVLQELGANIVGYSLLPPTSPNLFELCNLNNDITTIIGDVRDLDSLLFAMQKTQPEIVIHLAAQPIVLESYINPVYTYETNVMGTVNVLEAVRKTSSVKSMINVTTDKVYKNLERTEGYKEEDELNGYDPYSNSKSCSELVTSCYINSFFEKRNIAVTTCRAGNVIGGGDFAENRIIPDCVKAVEKRQPIVVRNPHSIRPYQHVLEPIVAYLYIAARQYEEKMYQGSYNIGPDEEDCLTTESIVELFCNTWNRVSVLNEPTTWITRQNPRALHEANYLKLDNTKIKQTFNWSPTWHIAEAIEKTTEWAKAYFNGNDMRVCTIKQIIEFLKERSC